MVLTKDEQKELRTLRRMFNKTSWGTKDYLRMIALEAKQEGK